jgi:hypothetical protein
VGKVLDGRYNLRMSIPLLDSFFKLLTTLINSIWGRKERRIKAAAAFRETLLKELQGLYPLPADWPPTTGIEPRLRKVFPTLQGAISAYRTFIPRNQQAAFDEAWLVYRTSTKREIDTQSYTHYMNMTSVTVSSFGGETVLPNDGKATFKRNVDRLLSFARDV